MKKKNLIAIGMIISGSLVLGACSSSVADTNRGNYEAEKDTETPTPEPVEEAAPTAEPTEAEEEPAATPEAVNEEDLSPIVLWEYDGYVDECAEYLWRTEFVDQDYDNDGKTDRLYRHYSDNDPDRAAYTIEFGNGETINITKGWNTGFPHVQAGDMNKDGWVDIVFDLSYDTSTHPPAAGQLWVFESVGGGPDYREAALPFGQGENGQRTLTIDYGTAIDNKVSFTVMQNGFTDTAELTDDFLTYNWVPEITREDKTVYDPRLELKNGRYVLHCYTEPFWRTWCFLEYDLACEGKSWEIEDMFYNTEPDTDW